MVVVVVIVRRYQPRSRERNIKRKEGRDAKKPITNPKGFCFCFCFFNQRRTKFKILRDPELSNSKVKINIFQNTSQNHLQ